MSPRPEALVAAQVLREPLITAISMQPSKARRLLSAEYGSLASWG